MKYINKKFLFSLVLILVLIFTANLAKVFANNEFTRDLHKGMNGKDVRDLQKFLNTHGFPLALEGKGSSGNETDLFGGLTKKAVILFQKKYDINPIGVVGPLTRAKILELLAVITPEVNNTQPVTTPLVLHYVLSGSHKDRRAPTVPAGLDFDNITQTTLSVLWTPSTDVGNSGLLGYHLERCEGTDCDSFSEIATPSVASFDDSGLDPDTDYSYRLRAEDNAGNFSDYSEILGVSTLPIPTHTLTFAKTGLGSGTVTSIPAGISCGATCTASFTEGEMVTLSSVTSVGSTFVGWSGDCTGTGACVVTMSAARSVTASFGLVNYALTVSKTGTGIGTVSSSPAGINCGATCSASFANGTVVTLVATPSMGNVFAGWSGAGCSGTGSCVVTMSATSLVTATFNEISS